MILKRNEQKKIKIWRLKEGKKVINAKKKFKEQDLVQVIRNPKRKGKLFCEKKIKLKNI